LWSVALVVEGVESNREALDERLKNFDGFYSARVTEIHEAGAETKDAVDAVTDHVQSLLKMVADELASMDVTIQNLHDDLKKEKDTVKAQKQKNEKLEGDLAKITESKQELEGSLAKEEAANKECQDKKKSLEDENIRLENSNYDCRKIMDELMDEVKKLTGENDQQVEIIKAKDEKIGVMQEENAKLKQTANDLNDRVAKISAEKTQCDAELQTSKKTVQDLMSSKEDVSKSLNQLKMDIGKVTAQKNELQKEVNKLTTENAQQTETIKAKEDAIGEMQKEISNLEKTANDLKVQADKVKKEKAQCDVDLKNSEKKVEDFVTAENQFIEIINELNNDNDKLAAEKENLQKEFNEFKKISEALGVENALLMDKVKKLEGQVSIIETQNEDQLKTITAKNSIIQDLQKEILSLKKKLGDQKSSEELQTKLDAALKEIEKLLEDNKKMRIELEISRGGYEMVNGRYVKLYNTKMSWDDAYETCQNASSRLIVAKDAKTRSWIKNRYTPMWIGGYRKFSGKSEQMTWIDDTPMGTDNWNPGQPDNGAGMWKENCVAANFKTLIWWSYGKWSDRSCSLHVKFACEIPDYPEKID